MGDDMTRAEIRRAMLDAGFNVQWIPVSVAREIVTGDRDYVSHSDTYGEWSEGNRQSYTTATYYANEPLVTAFELGDVASTCEYGSATTYDASNLRSLIRDYPNRVVRKSYHNGAVGLVLLASLDDDLTDVLTGLKEQYPIYDESDHSEYESELADKAWPEYVHADLTGDLNRRLDDAGIGIDLDAIIKEGELRELFYHCGYETPAVYTWTDRDGTEHRSEDWEWIEYHGESGAPDSVIFPRQDEITERIADIVLARARAIKRVEPSNAGCWIGGGWGWKGSTRLIDIAHGHGFPLDADDRAIIAAYDSGSDEPVTLASGEVIDADSIGGCVIDQGSLADTAEQWLNDHIAPEGYSFGWHDGEFFLWSAADWCDASDDRCQCDEPHGAPDTMPLF